MDSRLANAPGFGRCGACMYRESGPSALCYACASRKMEALAKWGDRCERCDHPFNLGEKSCRNPVCNFAEPSFKWNFAIAMRSGVLERAISAYKYDGKRGWGVIFGRILAGFLEERANSFRPFDLIVASPTWTGADGRSFDHTHEVLAYAASEVPPGSTWPFDINADPSIVKLSATPRLVGCSYKERRRIAENELRSSLRVTHRERIHRKQVLVYDDVFTDGLTLREVARALIRDGGALTVCGVTLCRQRYRRPAGAERTSLA